MFSSIHQVDQPSLLNIPHEGNDQKSLDIIYCQKWVTVIFRSYTPNTHYLILQVILRVSFEAFL